MGKKREVVNSIGKMLVKKLDNYRTKSWDEETLLLEIPRKFTIKYLKTRAIKCLLEKIWWLILRARTLTEQAVYKEEKLQCIQESRDLSWKLQFGFCFWYPEHYSQDHTVEIRFGSRLSNNSPQRNKAVKLIEIQYLANLYFLPNISV